MKRSGAVTLVILGTSGLLAGCGEKVESGAYETVESCISGGRYTEAECRNASDFAKQDAEKTAPRYASKEQCEENFGEGKCQTEQKSSSPSFFPILAGFMMGQRLADGRPAPTQALFRTNRSNFVTAKGNIVAPPAGLAASRPAQAAPAANRDANVTRGFAGRSSAVSS